MGPRPTFRVPLRVVFYKETGSWIAHCLEFDLAGDGVTRNDAFDNLAEAIAIQTTNAIAHNNAANLFSPADGKFFEMYAAGREVAEGTMEIVASLERLQSTSPMITSLDVRESEDHELPLALA